MTTLPPVHDVKSITKIFILEGIGRIAKAPFGGIGHAIDYGYEFMYGWEPEDGVPIDWPKDLTPIEGWVTISPELAMRFGEYKRTSIPHISLDNSKLLDVKNRVSGEGKHKFSDIRHNNEDKIEEVDSIKANELVSKEGYETLLIRPDIKIHGEYKAVYLLGKEGEYKYFVDALYYDKQVSTSLVTW
jgi:hypothetical protein